MPRIVLSKSAIGKLIDDPKLHLSAAAWSDDGKVPILWYFRRAYSTSPAGIITEHGDGFTLAMIDPTDAGETKDLVLESVLVANGARILVGADDLVMSTDFTIGWSKWKFTYEPNAPISPER